jgi:hypothetical protein
MYKLTAPNEFGKVTTVQRLADNAFIPFDPSNTDYQEYLRWLELGNTPEPADNVVNQGV